MGVKARTAYQIKQVSTVPHTQERLMQRCWACTPLQVHVKATN